ncbi:MAG: hypothetical protein IKX41_06425 [Oscillospiraceae bacterium]|nr:hypothetical protein [Oscillospiraceae bacterium]
MFIVFLFSAITLFFTVYLAGAADRYVANEFIPIEGSDLSVRYSSVFPDGLYTGDAVTGTLRVEGKFGYDWGAAVCGDRLYINEYKASPLGLNLTSVVCVDLKTYEKTVVMKNATLRGVCASGEPVVLSGYIAPSDFPQSNALVRLYAMTSRDMSPDHEGANVVFLDPATGAAVWSVRDGEALTDAFEARYLGRTLGEVKAG